jgi:hypothetical protein
MRHIFVCPKSLGHSWGDPSVVGRKEIGICTGRLSLVDALGVVAAGPAKDGMHDQGRKIGGSQYGSGYDIAGTERVSVYYDTQLRTKLPMNNEFFSTI